MSDNDFPTMNDFFYRGIPVDVANEAMKRWNDLTIEEKKLLGFNNDFSPLRDYLHTKGNIVGNIKIENISTTDNAIDYSRIDYSKIDYSKLDYSLFSIDYEALTAAENKRSKVKFIKSKEFKEYLVVASEENLLNDLLLEIGFKNIKN